MSCNTTSLSTFKSNEMDLCIDSLNLEQFKRSYAGGFSFNFINALSGCRDYKNKTYTNFYLTETSTLDKFVRFKSSRLTPKSIYTPLQFSKAAVASNFLHFTSDIIDTYFLYPYNSDYISIKSYGATFFANEQLDSDSLFLIEFIDDFFCSVAYLNNNKRYYLIATDDIAEQGVVPVMFVSENELTEDGRKLEYVITKEGTNQFLTLTTTKNTKKYIIIKQREKLIAQEINSLENIDVNYINNASAKIAFNQSTIVSNPLNTSFIQYTESDYLINENSSSFDIDSNYLFYKNNELQDGKFNIINLKNITDTEESFTASNNLLSSINNDNVYNGSIRSYTSILNDIDSEKDESLELNFVSYNLSYKILPGTNLFTAPSSLNPFTELNINDTRFVESGSFPALYPYFADKVYEEVGNIPGTESQYLCTWLSGHPAAAGIWVDRYYYPDLISKKDALNGKPLFNLTYQNTIEQLIESNSSLKSSVTNKLFFDKKSDLTFKPNHKYKYERLQNVQDINRALTLKYCAQQEKVTSDYYQDINNNGGYALAFKFYDNDFKVSSYVNDVNAGIIIQKTGNTLSLGFRFFDNAKKSTDFNIVFEKVVPLADLNTNDLYVTFNNTTGVGKVFLNSIEIFKYDILSFQLTNKQILFGNINVESLEFNGDILLADISSINSITDIFLSTSPLPIEDEIITIFSRNRQKVDDLYISLPCGMRNFTDNINYLNTLGANLKSKSNVVDINIDNLNISDVNILNDVKNNLLIDIERNLPATSIINKINFKNFL